MVEETGVPRENHRPVASHWQTLWHDVVLSTPHHDSKSNYSDYNHKCPDHNSQWAIIQLISYQEKITFQWDDDDSSVLDKHG